MEAQSALVRSDGAVELDAETAVDLDLALIVYPRHAEHEHAFRFQNALQQRSLLKLGIGVDDRAQGIQDLRGCLKKFVLARIFPGQLLQDGINIGHTRSLLTS